MNEDIKDILVWIATQFRKIDTIWKVASYIPSLFNINIENRGADFSSPVSLLSYPERLLLSFHSFVVSFYNEAKSLLTEGAFEDDFNPRRMDEMLYMCSLCSISYIILMWKVSCLMRTCCLPREYLRRERKDIIRNFTMENIFPLLFRSLSGRSDKGKPLQFDGFCKLGQIAVSIAVFDKMGQKYR